MILVTGATGNNGGEIVRQLVAAGAPVRALVRDPAKEAAKVAGFRAQGVDVVQGDLARAETLGAALAGVDAALLLSTAGPEQVQLQGNLITAAAAAGGPRRPRVVKFSMWGAAADSPLPLARWHAQTEQQLRDSGLAWTVLRPNDLMQNVQRFVPSIRDRGVIALPLGDARVSMVDLADVAAVAVRALTEGGHAGRTYELSGPEALSYADVAGALAAALGRPVRYEPATPEAFRQGLLAAGTPAAAADLFDTMYGLERGGSGERVTGDVAAVTGRAPRAFAAFAREWAPSVRPQAPATA